MLPKRKGLQNCFSSCEWQGSLRENEYPSKMPSSRQGSGFCSSNTYADLSMPSRMKNSFSVWDQICLMWDVGTSLVFCYELRQIQLLALGQVSAAEVEDTLVAIPSPCRADLPPMISSPAWPMFTSQSQQALPEYLGLNDSWISIRCPLSSVSSWHQVFLICRLFSICLLPPPGLPL